MNRGPAATSEPGPIDRRVALLIGCVLLCSAAFVGIAAAGDAPEVLEFESEEIEAAPGDRIEIDVLLRADGRTDSDAVERVDFRVDYPPEHLEVVELRPGPFIELEADTTVHSESFYDRDRGVGELQMWRDPVEGGVVGDARLATVVVEVDEDAPPSSVVLSTENTRIELTEEWPAFVYAGDVTVHVDGGGEEPVRPDLDIEGPGDGDSDGDATGEGATDDGEPETGEDAEGADSADGGDGAEGTDGSDGTDDGIASDSLLGDGAIAIAVLAGLGTIAYLGRQYAG